MSKIGWIAATLMLALVGCGGGSGDKVTEPPPPASAEEPMRAGAAVAKPLMGTAIVGQVYENLVGIVPNDARNRITALSVVNPTVGGAAPTIALDGKLSWTPNAVDLETTTKLVVRATLQSGDLVEFQLAVNVNRMAVVLEVDLNGEDASYSDADGRYLVRATRTDASRPIVGKVRIVEYFDKGQLLRWSVSGVGTVGSARFKVLNSPVVAIVQPQSSLSLQSDADHPLTGINLERQEFKDAGVREIGSVIRDGANVYTSRKKLEYTWTKNGDEITEAAESHQVFEYFSSCGDDVAACRLKATTKAPIVLIHGFTGNDSMVWFGDAARGGGAGTWGTLGRDLVVLGHPVFEMRWHTYMRFEEAAGALAKFTQAISQYTLKKPIVVAHSFGGIVAHLALQSKGIEFSGSAWRDVPYRGQIAKMVTLNSPLGGVNHPDGGLNRSEFESVKTGPNAVSVTLTRGRDHTDKMIGLCYAITCLQAGALYRDNNNNGLFLKANAALIAGETVTLNLKTSGEPETVTTISGNLAWEGESIKRLQDGLAGMSTPILRFAGFMETGVTDKNALLGDGLISLVGMAVNPADFAADPFNKQSNFGYKFIGDTPHPLYNTGVAPTQTSKTFKTMAAGDCFYWNGNPHEYVICAMSAHTGGIAGKRTSAKDFSIANLGDQDGIGDQKIVHPLTTLINDVNWVASLTPQDAILIEDLLTRAPESIFSWRAFRTVNGIAEFTYLLPALITVTEKATGKVVLQSNVFGDRSSRTYRFDLGRELTRELWAVPDLAAYTMTLQMGGGLFQLFNFAGYFHEFTNLFGTQVIFPNVDLTPIDGVAITGRVIDGQTTSTLVADATLYMAKGTDRSAAYLKNIPVVGTKTTRQLISNAQGAFSATGLEPGNYSVLVTKAGYTDELQGRVTIEAGTTLSLNVLRVLDSGEASITLRWANSSAGSGVVRDLDSHLIRFNASGTSDYHIYWLNKTVYGLLDSLDRDDIDYEGPETITLNLGSGKNYVYYVHKYSGAGTIVQSFPRVYLRIGSSTESFSPPNVQETAEYWRVFDIVNGVVRPCQTRCMQSSAPTGLATQSSVAELPAEVRQLLTNLPAKP